MPLNSLLRSSTFQALFERVASSVEIVVVSTGEARVDDSKEVRSATLANQIMANILEEDKYCNESGIDRNEKKSMGANGMIVKVTRWMESIL
jgi:hypothetical protein